MKRENWSSVYRILCPAITAMIIFINCISAQNNEAVITFSQVPDSITPGTPFNVSINYQTNFSDKNRRFVAVLRIRPAPGYPPLQEIAMDNSGEGYSQPQGVITFTGALQEAYSDRVFMEAYLAPYSLNDQIVEMLESYPTDGTHAYLWKGGGTTGHTRDLYYLDSLLARKQKGGTTFCCGLTFEVFLRVMQEYNEKIGRNAIGSITFNSMKRLRTEWFGATGDTEKQVVTGLVKNRLGIQIVNLEKARSGDFCMFWRHNKSGHSVIFMEWMKAGGSLIGIKYWSAQKSTNGIAYKTESIGPGGLDRNRLYIARLLKPRDYLDWEWKYCVTKNSIPVSVQ